MAYNDNSKLQTLFPLETTPQVSDEDFNNFHTIDRELYARLIQTMGRDPAESVQLMAFWMWLERESNDSRLVMRLLSVPLTLLNEIADESRVCLLCLENDKFQAHGELALLPEILNCQDWKTERYKDIIKSGTVEPRSGVLRLMDEAKASVSIRFISENRTAILRSITKIIATVCTRAFRDIVRGESSRAAERRMYNAPIVNVHPGLVQMPTSPVVGPMPVHFGNFPAAVGPRHVVGNDLGEMVNRNVNREENVVGRNQSILVDDRTIFLTFSKGYPIPEEEVKEYFTRRFGDFIENLIFQEVGEEEQVLYARMVVKPAAVAVMGNIAGRDKAKYTINGKHVWARKYVKKSRSPPRGRSGANSSSQVAATP